VREIVAVDTICVVEATVAVYVLDDRVGAVEGCVRVSRVTTYGVLPARREGGSPLVFQRQRQLAHVSSLVGARISCTSLVVVPLVHQMIPLAARAREVPNQRINLACASCTAIYASPAW